MNFSVEQYLMNRALKVLYKTEQWVLCVLVGGEIIDCLCAHSHLEQFPMIVPPRLVFPKKKNTYPAFTTQVNGHTTIKTAKRRPEIIYPKNSKVYHIYFTIIILVKTTKRKKCTPTFLGLYINNICHLRFFLLQIIIPERIFRLNSYFFLKKHDWRKYGDDM